MRVTVVAGNPKPASRTLHAAGLLAERLCGRPADDVVDVISLGADLLGWGGAQVKEAVQTVSSSSLVVIASPTYKGTYTGVLKLFLDHFETAQGLADVVAVPLMLGAAPTHAMAPDLLLKPVLVELGATCPTPGLYLLESTYADGPKLSEFAERWASVVKSLVRDTAPPA